MSTEKQSYKQFCEWGRRKRQSWSGSKVCLTLMVLLIQQNFLKILILKNKYINRAKLPSLKIKRTTIMIMIGAPAVFCKHNFLLYSSDSLSLMSYLGLHSRQGFELKKNTIMFVQLSCIVFTLQPNIFQKTEIWVFNGPFLNFTHVRKEDLVLILRGGSYMYVWWIVLPKCRALTRILKTGVPEPSLPKSGSPTIQKNTASFKNRSPSTKNGSSELQIVS